MHFSPRDNERKKRIAALSDEIKELVSKADNTPKDLLPMVVATLKRSNISQKQRGWLNSARKQLSNGHKVDQRTAQFILSIRR